MPFYKTVKIPSGFHRKRLLEFIKTYEEPEPLNAKDNTLNLDEPEPLFRVRWISPHLFEMKYFSYVRTRDFTGYVEMQKVQVEMAGTPEKPLLVMREMPSVGWLRAFWGVMVPILTYVAVVLYQYFHYSEDDPIHQGAVVRLAWILGVAVLTLLSIAVHLLVHSATPCEKRLRHMLARDDWDPEAVKG